MALFVKGTFERQLTVNKYLFVNKYGVNNVHVIQYDRHKIVLKTVVYTLVQINNDTFKIINGERVEWGELIHKTYFKDLQFKKQLDLTYYYNDSPSQEAIEWLFFDAEFHLKELVTGEPVRMFVSFIINGDYTNLLYTYCGRIRLDVFASIVSHDPFLVKACVLLNMITLWMKERFKAFVDNALVIAFIADDAAFANAYDRLVKDGVVIINDNRVYLKWAFEKRINQQTNHVLSLPPEKGEVNYDHTMALDMLIDKYQVVPSMYINTPIITIPVPTDIKVLKNEYEAREHVNTLLKDNKSAVITLSSNGDVRLYKHSFNLTCVINNTTLSVVNRTDPSFTGKRVYDCAMFNEIDFLKKLKVGGAVFLIVFNDKKEYRWYKWLKNEMHPDNQKIFVCY